MRLIKLLILDQFIINLQNQNTGQTDICRLNYPCICFNLSFGSADFISPSLHYFCSICRKELTNTIRIVAKTAGKTSTFFNYCPPCLSSSNNPHKVAQYVVCKRMNQSHKSLDDLTSEEVLVAMQELHQKGIEEFMFLSNDSLIGQISKNYEQLNQNVFSQIGLDIGIELNKPEKSKDFMSIEKPNPPNKKHLKALGYNWERQEFGSQPETVFGYLLGHLDSKEFETVQDRKLRQTICKYYQKEKETINEVNEFMVDSMFLLGRKGLSQMKIAAEILELRELEEEIKNLGIDVQNYASHFDSSQVKKPQESTKHEKGSQQSQTLKRQNRKESRLTKSEDKHKDINRSRSREKKITKRSSSSQRKQKRHRRERRVDDYAKEEHLNIEQQSSANHEETAKEPSAATLECSVPKKKRGRPPGSKNKTKPASTFVSSSENSRKADMSKKEQLLNKKQQKLRQSQQD